MERPVLQSAQRLRRRWRDAVDQALGREDGDGLEYEREDGRFLGKTLAERGGGRRVLILEEIAERLVERGAAEPAVVERAVRGAEVRGRRAARTRAGRRRRRRGPPDSGAGVR